MVLVHLVSIAPNGSRLASGKPEQDGLFPRTDGKACGNCIASVGRFGGHRAIDGIWNAESIDCYGHSSARAVIQRWQSVGYCVERD